jgi:DNA-binding XRE family transcriptional regulator
MTNYDETAGTEVPASLLEELRRSIQQEENTADLPEVPTDNEAWGDAYLGKTTLTSPAVVAAAADLVIEPQEPRPEARARMLEAASRALAERRKANGLLPVLLRNVRERSSMSLADVAAQAELTEEAVQELEAGDTEINLLLPVDTAVAWIRALPIDRRTALASLRRSLQVGWTGELAPAAGASDRPVNVDDYLKRVEAKLNAGSEEDAS